MGKAQHKCWTFVTGPGVKELKVQDNAELRMTMTSTVAGYFYTQTCAKMVQISCPPSCQRMLSVSSQALLEADSQTSDSQAAIELSLTRGSQWKAVAQNALGMGKHMFQ